MIWGPFVVALLAVFILQTTVLRFFAPASLDLLLTLALVCGLALPALDARLAGWFTGLALDLGSADPLGLHALLLGAAAFALTHLRELVNSEVWWVRWIIAVVVAWPAQFFAGAYLKWALGAPFGFGALVGHSFLSALLAGLIAALVVALPGVWGRNGRRRRSAARW